MMKLLNFRKKSNFTRKRLENCLKPIPWDGGGGGAAALPLPIIRITCFIGNLQILTILKFKNESNFNSNDRRLNADFKNFDELLLLSKIFVIY